MREKRQKLAVVVGRFQPFHAGHLDLLRHAAQEADHLLILVGGAWRPRSWRNPFTYEERRSFIEAHLETADLGVGAAILPLLDTLYSDRAWTANLRLAVRRRLRALGLEPEKVEIRLFGHEKDSSSRYLRWFPEWSWRDAPPHLHQGEVVSATDLREAAFLGALTPADAGRFGALSLALLRDWTRRHQAEAGRLRAEGAYLREYRAKIRAAEAAFGWPIAINTVDAVVVQSGHALLVRRGVAPGEGLWALPGGHLSPGETALDACLRELYEECRLDAPRGAVAARLKGRRVFDHPERSERGWVRTEAFFFELEDRPRLEKIKAGDDAAEAFWIPLAEITPERMFEDHFDILQAFAPEAPLAYGPLLMAHGV
ncbi:NUDIX domain-containing protein [Neomegalonema perideroedes]|uniref:NUDIX domain-containing protein n=1 Tax=Neomegalonema perideroedes TaxID=217219 RepID=UPI0003706800|nr:NUDIX domain-containing protein [Neomegalonema perideroedes]